MKRFFLHLCILTICVVVIDFAYGKLASYSFFHSVGGENEKMVTACDRTKADILIMGASKAKIDYNPQIIEDSLKFTCYNCGHGGTGILLMYGIFKMATQRYTPKLIIYDVTAEYDLLERDESQDLTLLRPYYHRVGIDSIFLDVNPIYKYRMISQMYQYNSTLIGLLKNMVSGAEPFEKGFEPFFDAMKKDPVIPSYNIKSTYKFSTLSLKYIEKMIKDCRDKHIKLVFFVGPKYKDERMGEFAPLELLCKRYSVPFIDNIDSTFNAEMKYFHDSHHLTLEGANIYTQNVIRVINNKIKL